MAPPAEKGPIAAVCGPARKHRRPKTLKPPMARTSRMAREVAGLSQQQLADAMRTPRAHIRRCEDPDPEVPNAVNVLQVARAPRAYARVMIEWQASQHGLQVVEAPEVEFSDGRARLAAVALASAELTTALASDMRVARNVASVLRAAKRAQSLSAEAWAWAAAELGREEC